MRLTRIQALALAIFLTLIGVAAARGGIFDRQANEPTAETSMDERALARGDIVIVEPAPIPAPPPRRS
jgi:hypothetical protein